MGDDASYTYTYMRAYGGRVPGTFVNNIFGSTTTAYQLQQQQTILKIYVIGCAHARPLVYFQAKSLDAVSRMNKR